MPSVLGSILSFLKAQTLPAGPRIRVCHHCELRAYNGFCPSLGEGRFRKRSFRPLLGRKGIHSFEASGSETVSPGYSVVPSLVMFPWFLLM